MNLSQMTAADLPCGRQSGALAPADARRAPFAFLWNALVGRIDKRERAAPTGDPLKNVGETEVLQHNIIDLGAQAAPLFSTAHASDARRAQAWLEAQFRRAEKAGGFTLDDVSISPVLAEVMLTANTHNRPITRSHVVNLTRAIVEGRWIPGARTIRFDTGRVLADGQHTLAAIVDAGMPAVVDVRFGVPAAARDVMDNGRARRAGDVVGLHGYPNAHNLSTAARFLRVIEGGIGGGSGRAKMDNDECLAFVESHPGLHTSVRVGISVYAALKVGVAPTSVAHYLISESGAPDAALADFFEVVRTGLGLTKKGDARYVLREYLVKGSYRNTVGHRSQPAILAAYILAWNAHKNGKRIRAVEVAPGASCPTVEAW